MSGICGVWCAPGNDLTLMVQAGLNAIEHRGRDGFSIFPDGNAVIGHCLFDTGCNGMVVDEAGYAIAFDGRIDNRSDIITALRARGSDLCVDFDTISDTALLLAAYRSFEFDLPGLLRGDFAIAIWDPITKALFLFRDHFGVKPLFYRRWGNELLFASEIKSLRAMVPGSPLTVREKAIDGFIDGESESGDHDQTCYEEILRILPAHQMVVDAQGVRITRYWDFNPTAPVRQADVSEQFRKLFAQAIDRRLRTTLPIGSLLSGGLDSSAIASMIGSKKTRVNASHVEFFSMTFGAIPSIDETPFIDAVLDEYSLTGVKFDSSGVTAFQELDAIIAEQDRPPPGPNNATFRNFLLRVAVSSNARVLLHGHGGDEVISNGTGIFFEFAEKGHWLKLWHGLGQSEDLLGPRRTHFYRLVRHRGLAMLRRPINRLLGRAQAELGGAVYRTPDGQPRPAEQILHLKRLCAPLFAQALEVIDHEAAAAGVELRMPFLDVDLVNFCVTVPASEKWHEGYPRALLRRALAGILPKSIAERRDKCDFSVHLGPSMLHDHAALIDETLRKNAGPLSRYANIAELQTQWQSFKTTGAAEGKFVMQLWRAVALSKWLQRESVTRNSDVGPMLAAAE